MNKRQILKIAREANNGVELMLKTTPEETRIVLENAGREINVNRWRIGDVANIYMATRDLLNAWLTDNDIDLYISADDVYFTVSIQTMREVGARTVSYYATNARFFVREIREAYDILPFAHFDLARQAGDEWRKVLNTSKIEFEKTNKIPSVEWVRKNCGAFVFENDNNYEMSTFDNSSENWLPVVIRGIRNGLNSLLSNIEGISDRKIIDMARELDKALSEYMFKLER